MNSHPVSQWLLTKSYGLRDVLPLLFCLFLLWIYDVASYQIICVFP